MENVYNEFNKLEFIGDKEFQLEDEWKKTVENIKSIVDLKADKSRVEKEPVEFQLSSETLPETRFFADVDSAHLECFFSKGSSDYLIVFLSGARSRANNKLAPYPTFSSWSWYKDINASILCIDDPMYNTYPYLALGWYYGTKTEDYRRATAVLVKKIAELLGVANKHIILYGRSGGGTAAIGISDYIKGCCVCAINAQIDLKKYGYHARLFKEQTGIDIYTDDEFNKRNDFASIIKRNPDNIYLVIINVYSNADAERSIPYFQRNFGVDVKYGLTSVSNLFTWVYAAWGISSPHNSFDSVSIFKIILEVIIALSNGVQAKVANIAVKSANDFWYERYNHLIKRNQYEKEIASLKDSLKEKDKKIAEYKNSFAGKCADFFKKIRAKFRSLLKNK